MGLFSQEIFHTALLGLFVAVSLLQMGFGALVWRFFHQQPLLDASSGQTPTGDLDRLSTPLPKVSIILCARNEARNLRLFLPGILAQQYSGSWEIIVVNDASEDESAAILLEFQQHHPYLRSIEIADKRHLGKKQALTVGIAAAQYEHILLTDADCSPNSPHWLNHMVEVFQQNPAIELVLGYSPMRSAKNTSLLGQWARFETAFTAMQYFTFAGYGLPYMGVGRNLAFKKAAFQRMGGFASHEHLLSGDDDLFVNAIANNTNTAWCLLPETFVYTTAKDTWKAWFRQKRRHLSAGTAYKWQHQWLLGMLAMLQAGYYFLLLLLCMLRVSPQLLLFCWLLRTLFLFFTCKKAFSRLHETTLLPLFVIFDMMLTLYYGLFVPMMLWRKQRSSWK